MALFILRRAIATTQFAHPVPHVLKKTTAQTEATLGPAVYVRVSRTSIRWRAKRCPTKVSRSRGRRGYASRDGDDARAARIIGEKSTQWPRSTRASNQNSYIREQGALYPYLYLEGPPCAPTHV